MSKLNRSCPVVSPVFLFLELAHSPMTVGFIRRCIDDEGEKGDYEGNLPNGGRPPCTTFVAVSGAVRDDDGCIDIVCGVKFLMTIRMIVDPGGVIVLSGKYYTLSAAQGVYKVHTNKRASEQSREQPGASRSMIAFAASQGKYEQSAISGSVRGRVMDRWMVMMMCTVQAVVFWC